MYTNLSTACLFFLAAGFAHADTMEIEAVADATVQFNGVNGQEIETEEESVQTSMSGGSNIRDGLFEFDLSLIPDDAIVESVTLQLRTANLISNTNSEAAVVFVGFAGDGALEIEDQDVPGITLAEEVFVTGTPIDTDIEIEFTNISIFNTVLNDGNVDDFLTVRSETENFVVLQVDSLESTHADAAPATLMVTYSGGVLLGDVNGDCRVDLLDVSPFVEAVANGDFIEQADCNRDGSVNLLDVDPFVLLLSGGASG